MYCKSPEAISEPSLILYLHSCKLHNRCRTCFLFCC